MKIICGSFTEGSSVTVEIGGKISTRKVFFNRTDGLFISVGGCKYFEYEFDY